MLDVNNDGLLDIAVANNNDFASLLVNLTPTTAPWVGLKCVPVHLCERVAISTRSQWFRDPFVAQRHYLSQSATGLILPHTDHPDEILAVHVDGEKAFEFSVAEHSGYWLIDVAARRTGARRHNHQSLH